MIRKLNIPVIVVALLLLGPFCGVDRVYAEDKTGYAEKLQQLERLLQKQQEQMEKQQQQMESMRRELDHLKQAGRREVDHLKQAGRRVADHLERAERRDVGKLKQRVDIVETEAEEAKILVDTHKTENKGFQPPPPRTITSGEDRVKLAISGQVNRAVNIADDGKDTRAYFVDNDASNSRLRLVGVARATDDLTLGTKIEIAIAPNESSKVSQDDQETGNFFDERWVELTLTSKRFGKISLGKGDTASNNSAEVDLSRTDVVDYADVSAIAGGLRFRQNGDEVLTDVSISDAFDDMDGLSRKNRVRYDSPLFYGFSLATSVISDGRYDGSLWWGGEGFGLEAVGAVAFADPHEDNTGYQYDGSFSVLHKDTGLNLTLSGGLRERDDQDNAGNFYAKVGWLARFFSFGHTAFGLDYTHSWSLPTEDYKGYSVGLAAVQQFEKYGTEFYLQYRLYALDRDFFPDVQDINVGTIGARVKF